MLTKPASDQALAEALVAFVRAQFGTDAFIPLHAPTLGVAEARAVAEVVESGMISTVGAQVGAFEAKLAEYTGAAHVIATINGTAALHLALIAIGLKPGEEVITQALTFVATANAIRYCAADPIFVDVDRSTMGLSPDAVEAFLDTHADRDNSGAVINKTTRRRIRACLPMHTNGHIGEITRLAEICDKWGLELVEDAAEALGSWRDGLHAGRKGRCGTLSFNGNKIISTGQGGAVMTDDAEVASRIRHLAATAKQSHPWRYIHDEVGYNYRLPALNAALGIAQMGRLPRFLASKRALATAYIDWFEEMGVTPVREPAGGCSNYWFNAFLADGPAARDTVLEATNAQGVMTRPLWDLLHTLPAFAGEGGAEVPNSVWLYERLVNVPSSPVM
jgi:perosamine synthetase